jgi:hypothetical protein
MSSIGKYIGQESVKLKSTTFRFAYALFFGVLSSHSTLSQAGIFAESVSFTHGLSSIAIHEHERLQSYRPNDEFAFDCTRGKKVGGATASKIDDALSEFKRIPVKNIFNANDSHEYLIFISTDGTSKDATAILSKNDLNLVRYLSALRKSRNVCLKLKKENKSGIDMAGFDDRIHEKGLPAQFPSNPALLAWLVSRSGNHQIYMVYVHGVGADPHASFAVNTNNAVTGNTLINQIDEAYYKVQGVIRTVHAKDASAKFVFVTTGFSRGAAAARVLNNTILQRGFKDEAGHSIVDSGAANIGASVLFDTVITQQVDMMDKTHGDRFRQSGSSNIKGIDAREYVIPKEVVQALHITAENEYREGFELKHANGSNVKEISLPGAHSDIGGGYGFGGISAVTLRMAMDYLSLAGVPMAALPHSFDPDPEKFAIHDSRKFPMMPFDDQLLQKRTSNDR